MGKNENNLKEERPSPLGLSFKNDLFHQGSGAHWELIPSLSQTSPGPNFGPPGRSLLLDTLGTSGSLPLSSQTEGTSENVENFIPLDPSKDTKELVRWGSELEGLSRIRIQVKEQLREIRSRTDYGETWLLSRASASLMACGKTYLVEKKKNGSFRYLNSFHCKKKYCPRCGAKKRDLLLAKYVEFFKSGPGLKLISEFDFAIFTVTLKHNKEGLRSGWYFPELKNHWRNSLKYGSFKKYLKGGFYSTEITYSEKNGFHIHRHAVVLIPKEFNFTDQAPEQARSKIVEELRASWLQKTGDSFQVDLTPFNSEEPFIKNFLEVMKYTAKPSRVKRINEEEREEEILITDSRIVEELEKNSREKFFNRFGNLYKEKGLAINEKALEQDPAALEVVEDLGSVYIASGLGLNRISGKYFFSELWPLSEKGKEVFRIYQRQSQNEKEKILLSLTGENFHRCYDKENKLSG